MIAVIQPRKMTTVCLINERTRVVLYTCSDQQKVWPRVEDFVYRVVIVSLYISRSFDSKKSPIFMKLTSTTTIIILIIIIMMMMLKIICKSNHWRDLRLFTNIYMLAYVNGV